MKKLLVIAVSAAMAASVFAPVAQAKHRMKKMTAAPAAPMMMAPMGDPRRNAAGEFYATPVGAAGPMGPMGLLAAPLAIPGAAVGGAADVAGTGLDVLSAPLK